MAGAALAQQFGSLKGSLKGSSKGSLKGSSKAKDAAVVEVDFGLPAVLLQEPDEVQKELGIEKEAAYHISIKVSFEECFRMVAAALYASLQGRLQHAQCCLIIWHGTVRCDDALTHCCCLLAEPRHWLPRCMTFIVHHF